jgi:transcriptional regulator with XRE-family HTH domain
MGAFIPRNRSFGHHIRALRADRNYVTMAEKIGISGPYLHSIERAQKPPPPEPVLNRMAAAYGVDPVALAFAAGRMPADVSRIIMGDIEMWSLVRAMKERGVSAASLLTIVTGDPWLLTETGNEKPSP